MARVRLLIGYHGAKYHGWQIQKTVPSIEQHITEAVEKISGQRIKVWGASRTDAGVHAIGQVAAFDEIDHRPAHIWHKALNRWTPEDINIHAVQHVDDTFHPRHHSRGKVYTYRISTGRLRDPMGLDRSWQLQRPLDLDAMREAAKVLIGEHDFSSFQAVGCDAHSPVRRIRRILVEDEGRHQIKVTVEGSAFLKYMVRNVVGSLVWVGTGLRPIAWLGEAMAAHDRCQAGQTAPAQGLTLEKIHFPHHPWIDYAGELYGD